MNKVIVIEEENHGTIGFAKDAKSAITFLIENGWIKENSIIFPRANDDRGETVFKVFGEYWKDVLPWLALGDIELLFANQFFFYGDTISST